MRVLFSKQKPDGEAEVGAVQNYLIPLIGFVLVVAAINWPLVQNLTTHVIGRPFEDVFEALWQLEWMRTAVFDLQTNPFYTPNVFYPQGWYLAGGAQPPWYMLAFSPLTQWLGAVTTYNLVQLATIILAGFGVYLISYAQTAVRWAGMAAGFVYIVSPQIVLRMGGHLNILLAVMWLPYFVFCYDKVVNEPADVRRRWIFLTGVFGALMMISSWYFIFVGTLPLWGMLFWSPTKHSWRYRVTNTFWAAVVCLLLVLPFVILTIQANQATFGQQPEFAIKVADKYSLSPDYLFFPNPGQPLWRDSLGEILPPIRGEQDLVSIGWAALLLAVLGLVFGSKNQTKPFVAFSVIALVFALGITLHWQGVRVTIPVSDALQQAFARWEPGIFVENGRLPVPLPALLLNKYLPLFSSIRVWSRFVIPLMLGVGVLAGFGVRGLLQRDKRWSSGLALFLTCMILFEGIVIPYPNFTAVSIHDRQADEWLSGQPQGTAVIEYPRSTVDKIAMYRQSFHGQAVVNGYMSFVPTIISQAESRLGKWPTPATIPVLQEWGVDFVIINGNDGEEFQQATLPTIVEISDLCPVQTFNDGYWIFTKTYVFAIKSPGTPCP